jgi:hypothetical protein
VWCRSALRLARRLVVGRLVEDNFYCAFPLNELGLRLFVSGHKQQVNSVLTVAQSGVDVQITSKSMSPTGRFVVVIDPKKNHRLVGTLTLILRISS